MSTAERTPVMVDQPRYDESHWKLSYSKLPPHNMHRQRSSLGILRAQYQSSDLKIFSLNSKHASRGRTQIISTKSKNVKRPPSSSSNVLKNRHIILLRPCYKGPIFSNINNRICVNACALRWETRVKIICARARDCTAAQ